ncbi:MAG: hypothetical protein NVS3B26_15020 [Mycobacteriales bacterium]
MPPYETGSSLPARAANTTDYRGCPSPNRPSSRSPTSKGSPTTYAVAPPRGNDRSGCQPIHPNPSLALIVELMAYGGLRIGEVRALRVKHVDVTGCKIVVAESLTEINGVFSFGSTKTHQVREVPLPRSLLTDLQEHLADRVQPAIDALLFTGKTGEPVHYTCMRRSFDAACRRVGLVGVTPHSLRASCASWVAESDGVLEAARRLGHSRSSITTRHYARPLAGGDRVVADRLDQARKEARRRSKPGETAFDMARVWHEDHEQPDRAAAPDNGKGL